MEIRQLSASWLGSAGASKIVPVTDALGVAGYMLKASGFGAEDLITSRQMGETDWE